MLGRSRFRSRARFLQSRALPTLSLDFLTGAPLDSRITFTRSTTATFFGSNGSLQTAAIDAPRFDYNPATLAPLGLLIEEERTNLQTYSEQFDNAAWAKSGSSITADVIVSPSGSLDGDKIVESATTAEHAIFPANYSATSTTLTASVYIKAAERTSVLLQIANFATGSALCRFNLSNGTAGSPSSNTGDYTNVSATIINAGNGWYRCTLTATKGTTNSNNYFVIGLDTGSTNYYEGNGVSGAFLYGAQLEVGAFATSYIPTVASTVTRAADIATMTSANFSSWYNASEGTFVASFEASPNTYTTYLAASNGTVAQNSMHMDNDGSGNMRAAYYSGSSAVALLSLGAVGTLNAVNKIATAYSVNDFAASRNGAAAVTDTAGAVPSGVDRLNIGADPSGAAVNVSNTHIRTITYYPSRLSNTQLQALSS